VTHLFYCALGFDDSLKMYFF